MVTVINCHHPKEGKPQADFVDPKTGRVLSTISLQNTQAAYKLASKLVYSGKWYIINSLSPSGRGIWRAIRLDLFDTNCPGWQEKALENAEANKR